MHHGACTSRPSDAKLQITSASGPEPLYYYNGDRIELTCETTGDPLDHVSWYKLYSEDNHFTFNDTDNGRVLIATGQVLTMQRALKDDTAVYQCGVKRCGKVLSNPVKVYVSEEFESLTAKMPSGK